MNVADGLRKFPWCISVGALFAERAQVAEPKGRILLTSSDPIVYPCCKERMRFLRDPLKFLALPESEKAGEDALPEQFNCCKASHRKKEILAIPAGLEPATCRLKADRPSKHATFRKMASALSSSKPDTASEYEARH